MEMKREFLHMVDRMGLEDAELALAEIVWQKAERAMQGKPVQEAVLLKSQHIGKSNPHVLSREEVQFLTMMITDMLNTAQVNMYALKAAIQEAWLVCDPEDEKTKQNFEALNHLRSVQRKIAPMMRKLEKIQHKLKKQR